MLETTKDMEFASLYAMGRQMGLSRKQSILGAIGILISEPYTEAQQQYMMENGGNDLAETLVNQDGPYNAYD